MKLTCQYKTESQEVHGRRVYDEEDETSNFTRFRNSIPLDDTAIAALNMSRVQLTGGETIIGASMSPGWGRSSPTMFLKVNERQKEDRSLYSFRWNFKVALCGQEGKTLIQKITNNKKYLRWLSYKKPINRGIFVTFEKESYLLQEGREIRASYHPNVGSYICTAGNLPAERLGRDNTINLLSNKINYDSPMTQPSTYIKAKTTKITIRPMGSRLKELVIEEDHPLFQEMLPLSYCSTLWDNNLITNSRRRRMPRSPCYDCAHSCPHSPKGKTAVWVRTRARQLHNTNRAKLSWPRFPLRFFLQSKKYNPSGMQKHMAVGNREWTLFSSAISRSQTWLNKLGETASHRHIMLQHDNILRTTTWPPEINDITPSDPEILRNFHEKIQTENRNRNTL